MLGNFSSVTKEFTGAPTDTCNSGIVEAQRGVCTALGSETLTVYVVRPLKKS